MKTTTSAARKGILANHKMCKNEATQKLEQQRGYSTKSGSTQAFFRGHRRHK